MPNITNAMRTRAVSIESIARGYSSLAIKTLAGIMQSPKMPPSARVAAANSILDRAWGKPKQAVEMDGEIRVTIRRILDDEPSSLVTIEAQALEPLSPNDINTLQGPSPEASGPEGNPVGPGGDKP
jgi:hypothetical protein